MTTLPSRNEKPDGRDSDGMYRVGTLSYTKLGLAMLFGWLLWGDFCYMLMEAVTPSLMPLKFKELGASNMELGIISGTIPGIVYSILNRSSVSGAIGSAAAGGAAFRLSFAAHH